MLVWIFNWSILLLLLPFFLFIAVFIFFLIGLLCKIFKVFILDFFLVILFNSSITSFLTLLFVGAFLSIILFNFGNE